MEKIDSNSQSPFSLLRRFSGFFDHNLRDRKDATTFSLVWKFR